MNFVSEPTTGETVKFSISPSARGIALDAPAQWEFLRGVGELTSELFFHSLSNLHQHPSDGHFNTQAASANLRLRYNYRPDSDLYIIYNVGTQFASIAPANPRRFARPVSLEVDLFVRSVNPSFKRPGRLAKFRVCVWWQQTCCHVQSLVLKPEPTPVRAAATPLDSDPRQRSEVLPRPKPAISIPLRWSW